MESTKIITHVYCYFFEFFFCLLTFSSKVKTENNGYYITETNIPNNIYIGTYTNWCIFCSLTAHVLALFIYYFNGNLI